MNFTKKSVLLSLSLLVGVSFLLIYVTNHLILTPSFYAHSGHQLSGIRGEDVLVYASYQKWMYLFQGVYIIFKASFVSLLIYTVLYLLGHQVRFLAALGIVVYAEFVFLISAICKATWFYYSFPHGTLADWQHAYPLSALSLIGKIPADWYYMLQTLSLFELGYCGILAFGLQLITPLGFCQSVKVVAISYVPALLVWITGVTFCNLMFFPDHA